jgi:hypothetical protein
LPIAAVAVEPQRRLEDRPGVEAAAADPAGALLRDEACAHQDVDVTRHRLQRNGERLGQFGDEQVLTIKTVEDRSPDRVGQRAEYQV